MLATPRAWKSFGDARNWMSKSALRVSEVPIPSWLSEPMPTRRLPRPTWVWFCAPAHFAPDRSRVSTPDRWFAMDARTGKLAACAREAVVGLVRSDMKDVGSPTELIDIEPSALSLEDLQSASSSLGDTFDRVSDAFFEGRWSPASNRKDLTELLSVTVPKAIMPFYAALAPDFFAWIKADDGHLST